MSICTNVGNVNSLLIDSAFPKTIFKDRQEAFSFKLIVKQMSMKNNFRTFLNPSKTHGIIMTQGTYDSCCVYKNTML